MKMVQRFAHGLEGVSSDLGSGLFLFVEVLHCLISSSFNFVMPLGGT